MTPSENIERMRCWTSGEQPGCANLQFDEAPVPEQQPGTMLVRVHAAALNFSDLLMIDGKYQVRPPRPFIPGQEVSGTVVKTTGESRWKAGDRIASKVFWGGFAQYVSVREDMAMALPDDLDFARGAALPVVYMTAMVALHDSVIAGPQDTVLVHAAAGGVGLAAVEIAKAAGARVIATAGTDAKRHLALQHGADIAIDYRGDGWKDEVKAATDGKGASIIVDPVGGDIAVESLRCLARHGTLLIVGFASGTIARLPSNYLLLNSATVKGVLWDHDRDASIVAEMTERLWDLWNRKKINPVVDTRFSLEDLPRALDELASRGSTGKLILKV
ncbi:MAG: NADPH:quinone oxidoreductase family protein [Alphaproteobacteria bacterium]|nr:NADPH:quinone oxidoreductase family protein [Alphaproteobacteria bacterium]